MATSATTCPSSEQDRSSHVDPDDIEPYSNDDLLDKLEDIRNLELSP